MAETRITTKLKPCPFCGAKRVRRWVISSGCYVGCTKCGAEGPFAEGDARTDPDFDQADAEASRLWNKRAK